MASSILQDYISNYGPRLQSALQPATPTATVTNTAPVVGEGAQISALDTAPQGAALQVEPGAPDGGQPVSDMEEQGGKSFQQYWHEMPAEQQTQETDNLEKVLSKGNQTIDSAYDDMVTKLGTRPKNKLTREDKGMLLMQFGLSLMANSSSEAYGEDLGGAIGASGLQTMGGYQQMKQSKHGEQQTFDKNRSALEAGRTTAKSKLAQDASTEHVKQRSALEQTQLKNQQDMDQITGTLDTEDGVYSYTKGGKVSALQDPTTKKPLKARIKTSEPLVAVDDGSGGSVYVPRSEAAGQKKAPTASAAKPFKMTATDSNTLYRQAVGLFGGMYDPISGRISGLSRDQSEQVQSIASRASEIYREGAGEVDHATAINEAFEQVKGGGAPSTAAPAAAQPQQFKTEQEVGTALKNGSIKIGDVVTVNGKRFKVQ